MSSLEEKLKDVIIKERKVKQQLVEKLEKIKDLIYRYQSGRSHRSRGIRNSSKAGGIPFGLAKKISVRKAKAFLPISNAGDRNHAENLIREIRKILN